MDYLMTKESLDRLAQVYNALNRMTISGRDNASIYVACMDEIKEIISKAAISEPKSKEHPDE